MNKGKTGEKKNYWQKYQIESFYFKIQWRTPTNRMSSYMAKFLPVNLESLFVASGIHADFLQLN